MDNLPRFYLGVDLAVWRNNSAARAQCVDRRTRHNTYEGQHIYHNLHGNFGPSLKYMRY